MKLKENLRMLRKQHGWTQAELAKKLKVKQYNISDYEIGRIEPNVNTLIKLANIFDVSIDFLVGRTNDNANEGNEVKQFTDTVSDSQILKIYNELESLKPEEKRKIIDMVQFMTDSLKDK